MMVRRKVIARDRAFRCPVCPYQAYTKRGLAQHLAMKRDEAHVAWRRSHGLPEDYETMLDVIAMIPRIIEVLG